MEDCSGASYNTVEVDEVAIKEINRKRHGFGMKLTEDIFEEVMSFFEETAQSKQPFAAVDNPPVLSHDEMVNAFDETISEKARGFSKEIYEHWRARRTAEGNQPLQPTLKVRDCNIMRIVQANLLLIDHSSRLVARPMKVIHTCVSVGEK